jgi:hypothetical protein
LANHVHTRSDLHESPGCPSATASKDTAGTGGEHSGDPESFLPDLGPPYRVDAGEERKEQGPQAPVDRRAGESGGEQLLPRQNPVLVTADSLSGQPEVI